MLEQSLLAHVRATLLLELPAGVGVEVKFQPATAGTPSTPTVFMQVLIPGRRVGWLGRKEILDLGLEAFQHLEIQWLETTLQISALAHRDPARPDFMTLLGASDYCQMAADILQGDAGLKALAVERVRPLRVTTMRTVQFINDYQQYEANPSFDIVLSHVQIRESVTPPVAEFVGSAGSV